MAIGTLEGGKDEEVPVQPIGSVIETAAVEAVGIMQNLPDEGVYLETTVVTAAVKGDGRADVLLLVGGELVLLPKGVVHLPLGLGGTRAVTRVVAVVVAGLVVEEGTTEGKESATGLIEFLGDEGDGNHDAIEVASIVDATLGVVEEFFFQVEVGIVLDSDERKGIDDGLSQRGSAELKGLICHILFCVFIVLNFLHVKIEFFSLQRNGFYTYKKNSMISALLYFGQ